MEFRRRVWGSGVCLFFVGAVLLTGCSKQLTPAGAEVRIGKFAHANCEELDVVYGSGGGGGYTSSEDKMSSAQNELRNKTAALGGNLVVLDAAGGDTTGITISGRAFKCGEEPPTPVHVVQDDTEPTEERAADGAAESAEARLEKLKSLLDKGLISQEEHDAQRAKILDTL